MTLKKSFFKKGFTLTELLVVVLLLGVLAAVALPAYTKSVRKSRASDALNNLNIVSMKQQDYMLNNEKYAETFTELNVPVSGLAANASAATSGNFTYTLKESCVYANSNTADNYQFVKNVDTQDVGCINGGDKDLCKLFSDLVPTKTADSISCPPVNISDDGPSGLVPPTPPTPPTPTYNCLGLQPPAIESCGQKCGTHTRQVTCDTSTGNWVTGEWGECSNEGVCAPNSTESANCSETNSSQKTRTCTSSCTWGAWNEDGCNNKCDDTVYAKEHACECNPNSSTCCADNYKSVWDSNTKQCVCQSGTHDSNGMCCPIGQVSLDGKKCVYEYVPERVTVGILANCHENYNYADSKKTKCRRNSKKYFVGGKLPNIPAGGAGENCSAHHAYYNGGYWWEGGEYQGDTVPTCNSAKTDAELCTQNCTAATCDFKCMRSESVPDTCGVYKCSNGKHCDNASGSGTMLRCKRKN